MLLGHVELNGVVAQSDCMDCNTCGHKSEASKESYCSEFVEMPQLNSCSAHTKFDAKKSNTDNTKNSPSGLYHPLNQYVSDIPLESRK